ncbi:pyridoxamine 5-phosphate oxidase, partial [Halorubrum sp. E3]
MGDTEKLPIGAGVGIIERVDLDALTPETIAQYG